METVGLDSFPLTSETFSNITGESNLKLTSHGPFLLQCLPHNKIDPANQATMQSPSFPPLGLQLLRLVELLASPTVSSLLGEKHYVTAQEISTGSALVSSLTARVLIGQKLVK